MRVAHNRSTDRLTIKMSEGFTLGGIFTGATSSCLLKSIQTFTGLSTFNVTGIIEPETWDFMILYWISTNSFISVSGASYSISGGNNYNSPGFLPAISPSVAIAVSNGSGSAIQPAVVNYADGALTATNCTCQNGAWTIFFFSL